MYQAPLGGTRTTCPYPPPSGSWGLPPPLTFLPPSFLPPPPTLPLKLLLDVLCDGGVGANTMLLHLGEQITLGQAGRGLSGALGRGGGRGEGRGGCSSGQAGRGLKWHPGEREDGVPREIQASVAPNLPTHVHTCPSPGTPNLSTPAHTIHANHTCTRLRSAGMKVCPCWKTGSSRPPQPW